MTHEDPSSSQSKPKAIDSSAMKAAVFDYLTGLQDDLCEALSTLDGSAEFQHDNWQKEKNERVLSGEGRTRVLTDGKIFEKGGVNFSHVSGASLPVSASERKPELAGRRFEAMGVSLVMHPNNPMVPISHMNVRFFIAEQDGAEPLWWFGGGYDLTPTYPYQEDCLHWHKTAKAACDALDPAYYEEMKSWCDRYFYLPHRNETRGIGGLFFDDFHRNNFSHSFDFMRSVGDSYLEAYTPIVEKRHQETFNEKQRAFQLYRRGRYVEFNLVYDRGTLFGLQSGGRTESILMSMPPLAAWEYQYQPSAASREAELQEFLKPRDWFAER